MCVFLDLDNSGFYKAKDLQELRSFLDKNFNININIEWWEIGAGAKVIFSKCGEYSVEPCSDDLQGIHLFQAIAKEEIPPQKQN